MFVTLSLDDIAVFLDYISSPLSATEILAFKPIARDFIPQFFVLEKTLNFDDMEPFSPGTNALFTATENKIRYALGDTIALGFFAWGKSLISMEHELHYLVHVVYDTFRLLISSEAIGHNASASLSGDPATVIIANMERIRGFQQQLDRLETLHTDDWSVHLTHMMNTRYGENEHDSAISPYDWLSIIIEIFGVKILFNELYTKLSDDNFTTVVELITNHSRWLRAKALNNSNGPYHRLPDLNLLYI
ncbi:MAG: hypothetical protein AAF787_16785 [Chloroflexota bacterium]